MNTPGGYARLLSAYRAFALCALNSPSYRVTLVCNSDNELAYSILRLFMRIHRVFFLLALLITLSAAGPMRTDPPCSANVRFPRRPPGMCPENVVNYDYIPGITSISALAFGSDGALYFARPTTSEIVRLAPDETGFITVQNANPQVFAGKLPEPPNGLTYFDDAWYISGDTTITRVRDTNNDGSADVQEVIVRDLPGGVGGWLGNLHVGPDKRLYVAK